MKGILNLLIIKMILIKTFFKRVYNNFIKGEIVAETGIEMYKYLAKILNENYQPVTMSDYRFEGIFNKKHLTGRQRIDEAYRYFAFLEEHLPFGVRVE